MLVLSPLPQTMSTLSNFSSESPLLLAMDYPLSAGGGGAVILRSLLGEAERSRIVWASPSLPAGNSPEPDGGYALRRGSLRFGPMIKRRSQTLDALLAESLSDEILAVARGRGARAIWIVMHGAMVHVAARVLKRTTLPVHLTVHDDPPYGVALLSRRHVALVPLIERDLAFALRRARSVDVISQSMADRYRIRYGVSSLVVHRGMAVPIASSPPRDRGEPLEVGILGNTYGYPQLLLLAGALIQASSVAGVPARIVVIGQGHGQRLRDELKGRLEVEVTGHLEEAAAVERLRRCFLLYLNYPFSARARVLRQTSFPTKLSTYIQAARPLLVHAPADSSVAPLFDLDGGYVTGWRNERPSEGAAVIVRAWKSEASHASHHVAAEDLRNQYYELTRNRRVLLDALNQLAATV
jgi:hypothetical protein